MSFFTTGKGILALLEFLDRDHVRQLEEMHHLHPAPDIDHHKGRGEDGSRSLQFGVYWAGALGGALGGGVVPAG
jgi:hypothetical protein